MSQNKNKSRTLVNVLGIPCLLLVIWQGGVIFSLFVALIMAIGAFELCSLAKSNNSANPSFIILLIGVLGICVLYTYFSENHNYQIYWIVFIVIATMIAEIFRRKNGSLLNMSVITFGLIWIGIMLGSMIAIRNIPQYGLVITLSMFISVWICDTFAFFFGSKFGKRKILPSVSPHKTWVGSMSGMFGSIIFMILLYSNNVYGDWISLSQAICFGFIFGGMSQLGDFAESLLKREVGVKDTSNILRGHGGVLDRFDSISVAAPLTFLYILFIDLLNY